MVIKALDPYWILIRIGLQHQTLDPDKMNTDPQPCVPYMYDRVVDPYHVDADPDSTYYPDAGPDSEFYFMRTWIFFMLMRIPDPNPNIHPDTDPNPNFHHDTDPNSFQINAQPLENVLK